MMLTLLTVSLLLNLFSPNLSIATYPTPKVASKSVLSSRILNRPLRTLLIDNYDSYTYNLWQMLCAEEKRLCSKDAIEPIVVRNDDFQASWSNLVHSIGPIDNIIISPGPGHPENPPDFGLCRDAILHRNVPLLGVCLGHQGIASAYGGRVIRAPIPYHGRISRISHTNSDVFAGVVQSSEVVRYHSLVVEEDSLPACLAITARTLDSGLIMGLRHRRKPQYGVQFHPESICTAEGQLMLSNFRRLTLQHHHQQELLQQHNKKSTSHDIMEPKKIYFSAESNQHLKANSTTATAKVQDTASKAGKIRRHTLILSIPLSSSTQTPPNLALLFRQLFGDKEHSFFLDQSCAGPSPASTCIRDKPLPQHALRPRISYLGALDPSFEEDRLLVYKQQPAQVVEVQSSNGSMISSQANITVLDYLQTELAIPVEHCYHNSGSVSSQQHVQEQQRLLPFTAGYVGYLGYELGEDIFPTLQQRSSSDMSDSSVLPIAMLLKPSRFVRYDHDQRQFNVFATIDQQLYLDDSNDSKVVEAIKQKLQQRAEELSQATHSFLHQKQQPIPTPATAADDSLTLPLLSACCSGEEYRTRIASCLEAIVAGDSYELCLTAQFSGPLQPAHRQDYLAIYERLRQANPAPHAAYLRLGYDLAICCSSPEQFLRIDRHGQMISRPIKGTARRDKTNPTNDLGIAKRLKAEEKSRAENLMVVDLVRNDLGRIAVPGSVTVPGLFDVESFATVHQLVSSVSGVLDKSRFTAVDAIKAAFPGGSMTGAPKLRTMQIIKELEQRPRGVYSGAIGYIGLDGQMDLNIVIRTALLRGEMITVGAGGAIVALSDPAQEVEEVLLKARAVAASLGYDAAFPAIDSSTS